MAVAVLNGLVGSLSGKVGNVVFVNTADCIIVRARPSRTRKTSEAQLAARERMRIASRAWQKLSEPTVKAWGEYAKSLQSFDSATGRTFAPRPMNLFTTLYGKLLQIDLEAEPPLNPPSLVFTGDALSPVITAEAGAIQISSSAPNAGGVTTELLLQPLAGQNRRTYVERYRAAAFHTFSADSSSVSLPVRAGWYAMAIRFVLLATGQSSAVVELGKVQVP